MPFVFTLTLSYDNTNDKKLSAESIFNKPLIYIMHFN